MLNSFFIKNMGHDLFRYKALSKNGLRLIEFMIDNPNLTIIEISKKAGLCLRTVRRKIERMKNASLVQADSEKRNAHYSIVKYPDLDRAAAILGTTGARDKQRDLHQREREAWRLKRKAYSERMRKQTYETSSRVIN